MVELSRAVIQKLLNESSLTAIVGQEIYPNIAPQGTDMPFLIFTQQLEKVHCRAGNGSHVGSVMIEIWADGYEELHSILDKVVAALENQDLSNGDQKVSVFDGIDRMDLIDEELRGHKKAIEFEVYVG